MSPTGECTYQLNPDKLDQLRKEAFKEMLDFINWLASKHPKIWDILCDEYVAYLSKQKSKGEEKKGERGTRGKKEKSRLE